MTIEKIKKQQSYRIVDEMKSSLMPVPFEVINKLNEIIDAINKLQKQVDNLD